MHTESFSIYTAASKIKKTNKQTPVPAGETQQYTNTAWEIEREGVGGCGGVNSEQISKVRNGVSLKALRSWACRKTVDQKHTHKLAFSPPTHTLSFIPFPSK